MSLARALSRLPDDRPTEVLLRDVLSLLRKHPGEWLSETDVAMRTGHPVARTGAVLRVLAECFVIEVDAAGERYRLLPGAALSYEIDGYMRRVQSHRDHVETNIARFRERYGG